MDPISRSQSWCRGPGRRDRRLSSRLDLQRAALLIQHCQWRVGGVEGVHPAAVAMKSLSSARKARNDVNHGHRYVGLPYMNKRLWHKVRQIVDSGPKEDRTVAVPPVIVSGI